MESLSIFIGITFSRYLYKAIIHTNNNKLLTNINHNTINKDSSKTKRSNRTLIRKKFSATKISNIDNDIDTIIIGSGMSGLSCGAILSRLGRKVLVLEQHPDVAGGGTHQFDLNGYRFDSGLHYTVPWSVPIFALTCLKSIEEVCPFEIMGDSDGTVDKIYLHPVVDNVVVADSDKQSRLNNNAYSTSTILPFNMKHREQHMHQLYTDFPEEHHALDQFILLSDRAMLFVKYFIFGRLLPSWLQTLYWKCVVPTNLIEVASKTAKEILPTLTHNKRLISLLSSMWIDTGARPDQASFMMTAAVFRGVSMEGGCYPSKGSEEMAIELTKVITTHGGSVLIRATVDEICIKGNQVVGVYVHSNNNPNSSSNNDYTATATTTIGSSSNSTPGNHSSSIFIPCKRVVSSAGYFNTFTKLIRDDITTKFHIPKHLSVPQSAGFVMVNIGIDNTNTWHIPVDHNMDAFESMSAYFDHPLEMGSLGIPAFITFPAMKDKEWNTIHPNKISCQMLIMAQYHWFTQCKDKKAYDELKASWKQRAIEIFLTYFPKTKDSIELVDISTPCTIERWLHAEHGCAVGIDVTPDRFVNAETRQQLDCVVDKIKGLYLTGQDVVLCGVTLCQLAGVITAFRMEGFFPSMSILFQSIWRDIKKSYLL